MKYTLTLIALFFSFSIFAQDLTDAKEQATLEAIDNICGDTWCEGEYDYSFNLLECDFSEKSCELSFEYLLWGQSEDGEWLVTEAHPATCTITGMTKNTKLLRENALPSDVLYDKVSECIDSHYPEY